MKFHLDNNIVEGTPEELVKYQELLEDKDEAETSSSELQVGDRVKVLRSEFGAEGEATVTAVREDGDVELAGTNKQGTYSEEWSNNVSNLEKIEEEEEDIKGYTFWYLDGSTFNNRTVLKTTLGGHFEDSKGRRYTYQSLHGLINPINRENVREEFEEAKHSGGILKYYPALDVFVKEY